MNGFCVNGTIYSDKNVLIIAELGTSHNGDLGKARELIDAAAGAGADCVKTQIVYAAEILHPNTGSVPLPGGNIRLYDVFKKLERNRDFFAELKQYAESKKLLFLATPFGPKSAEELRSLNPAFVKIASPELNYTQLLQITGGWKIPAVLSCGVSTLADIESALAFFEREKLCLLHCVTAYPAPETEYNLRLLDSLRSIFGVCTGLSDHSLDPVLAPSLAVACGACAVEKHFCLSSSDSGLDDPIALTPPSFAKMSKAIRYAQSCEKDETINRRIAEYGEETVLAVLGDGVKRLAPSEAQNYTRTNRSIHALCAIREGEALSEENCAVLRTEKLLRPGLPPFMMEKIAGRRARAFIPSGEGIRFEDMM